MYLNKQDKQSLSDFYHIIRDNGITDLKFILFGSFAKGKAHKDSDIDIAVVSRRFGRDTAKEMMFLRKIAARMDSRIEPVPLCPKDFDDRYSTLVQEIKLFGKDLKLK